MKRKKHPPKFRKQVALMRLINGWKYKHIADFSRVSIGTVQNCVKQYKTNHPIWLKVRTIVHKLVN